MQLTHYCEIEPFWDYHRSGRFLHLGPQNLHVGPPFSLVGRSVYGVTILQLNYFISTGFQAGGFCILGHKTGMSARHFHRSAGPSIFYYFTFTISFPLGSRQEVFASWAARPACRPAIFTGRPDRLLFYYFIFTGFQAGGFASRAAKLECRPIIFTDRPDRLLFLLFYFYSFISFHWVPGRRFISGRRMSARHFHRSAGPSTISLFYFYDFICTRFQVGGFCILGRKTCMSARHFHPSTGPFFILLFCDFISMKFQAGGFCISGHKTRMSARHFHRSAGPFPILLFYDFISIRF